MVPKRLEDWSYHRIKELVDKNINESKTHDFKFVLPNSIELTKDCCAFANTDGGFIVFGPLNEENRYYQGFMDGCMYVDGILGMCVNLQPMLTDRLLIA